MQVIGYNKANMLAALLDTGHIVEVLRIFHATPLSGESYHLIAEALEERQKVRAEMRHAMGNQKMWNDKAREYLANYNTDAELAVKHNPEVA